jgi:hypothetical protein
MVGYTMHSQHTSKIETHELLTWSLSFAREKANNNRIGCAAMLSLITFLCDFHSSISASLPKIKSVRATEEQDEVGCCGHLSQKKIDVEGNRC